MQDFKIGTIFVGNVNNIKMQIIDIFYKSFGTGLKDRQIIARKPTVRFKNLDDGSEHICGLEMLKHCNVTILN